MLKFPIVPQVEQIHKFLLVECISFFFKGKVESQIEAPGRREISFAFFSMGFIFSRSSFNFFALCDDNSDFNFAKFLLSSGCLSEVQSGYLHVSSEIRKSFFFEFENSHSANSVTSIIPNPPILIGREKRRLSSKLH